MLAVGSIHTAHYLTYVTKARGKYIYLVVLSFYILCVVVV